MDDIDILRDIIGLEQTDVSADPDLSSMLLQLSSTVPELPQIDSDPGLTMGTPRITSASAPAENEIEAWNKDRLKKDNHNQSRFNPEQGVIIISLLHL